MRSNKIPKVLGDWAKPRIVHWGCIGHQGETSEGNNPQWNRRKGVTKTNSSLLEQTPQAEYP